MQFTAANPFWADQIKRFEWSVPYPPTRVCRDFEILGQGSIYPQGEEAFTVVRNRDRVWILRQQSTDVLLIEHLLTDDEWADHKYWLRGWGVGDALLALIYSYVAPENCPIYLLEEYAHWTPSSSRRARSKTLTKVESGTS